MPPPSPRRDTSRYVLTRRRVACVFAARTCLRARYEARKPSAALRIAGEIRVYVVSVRVRVRVCVCVRMREDARARLRA